MEKIINVLGKNFILTSNSNLTAGKINQVMQELQTLIRAGLDLKTAAQCALWIWDVSVNGLTVTFNVAIANDPWSATLKDSSGVVEASLSGYGYGTHTMTGKTAGPHTLTVCGSWSGAPCGNCPVTLVSPACIPSWKCEQPLNGYEADGCGNRRLNTACNPTCTPSWTCELPLNGYEKDGCGNRRINTICNPTGGCIPNWQCEKPLNGYEADGCGNRRTNTSCNPAPSGPGAGYIIGIGLLGFGALGAVVYASSKKRR